MTDFESPYHDWPKVEVSKDGGGGVHITGKYLAPGERFKVFWIAIAMTAVVTVMLLAIGGLYSQKGWWGAALLALGISSFFALHAFYKHGASSYVDVFLTRDSIRVWQDGAYKNYDRRVPIEIKIEQHHKVHKRLSQKQAETYRNAMEVVMWYGQKRIVLAELEGEDMPKAQSLVLRFQEAMAKIAMADAMMSRSAATASAGDDSEIR